MSEILTLIEQELAPRFGLSAAQCEQFARYYALLVDWNSRINLTAITEPQAVVEKHFLDSLLLLDDVQFKEGDTLIDVGTGAGFPGIPLAIVCPGLEVTLLDSLRKRVTFLETVCGELELSNVTAAHERAELFAKQTAHRDAYDWATARAVARLPLLCEYCLPFVKAGGHFIACKGPDGAAELVEADKALAALNGRHKATYHHTLPGGETRDILLIEKTAPTPKRFPRKPGTAAKSPLV